MKPRILQKGQLLFKRFRKRLALVSLDKLAPYIRRNPNFPGSAGTERQYLELTLKGSNELIHLLNIVGQTESLEPITLASEAFVETEHSVRLRDIFDKFGSDKGTQHNYDLIYSSILMNYSEKEFDILEIGLGTNNLDVVSNMGIQGRPGASLRSWREFLPQARIVGCDIDSRILFSENQIETYFLDQTSDDSWINLFSTLGDRKFDLIVDDGLHAPFANLRTIIHGLPRLKKNGSIVIEDISLNGLPVFQLLKNELLSDYNCEIVKTRRSIVFIVRT
jgi:hypothetical protein